MTVQPTDNLIIGRAGEAKKISYSNFVNSLENDISASSVVVSETAPPSPNEGDLWYSTADARLYIYFNDGNTTQWADASPSLGGSNFDIDDWSNIPARS